MLKSPEAKLKCVVKSARDLVKSVANFHRYHGRNPDKYPVGGDELLPIFTYVVIRSGVKNLISESSFMELCISDDDSRGECGYILATLQTVIAFLSCLDNTLISKSVDSVFASIAKEIHEDQQQQIVAQIQPPLAQDQVIVLQQPASSQQQILDQNMVELEEIGDNVIPPSHIPPLASHPSDISPSAASLAQPPKVSVFDKHLPDQHGVDEVASSAFAPFSYDDSPPAAIELDDFNPRAI